MGISSIDTSSWKIDVGNEQLYQWRFIIQGLAASAALFYIVTAVLTVVLFVNSLLNVATSGQDLQEYHSNNKQFNRVQHRLINSVSRYVGLFSIALFTSIVSVTMIFADSWWPEGSHTYGQVTSIVSNIDAIINLICLYLQFSFNIKYYEKLCGCLDCWKSIFMRKVHDNIGRIATEPSDIEITELPLKGETEDCHEIVECSAEDAHISFR